MISVECAASGVDPAVLAEAKGKDVMGGVIDVGTEEIETPETVAARIRRELGVEVEMIRGHYGEYKILVDGETVVDGGALVVIGVMPPARKSVELVRARLSA